MRRKRLELTSGDAELQNEILHAMVKHYKFDFRARAVNARG